MSVRSARMVITDSRAVSRAAQQELGLRAERTTVIPPAVVGAFGERVRVMRAEVAPEPMLLYVGQNKSHKNLQSAVAGFAVSDFAASGGRFVMVGGRPGETGAFREWLRHDGYDKVEVRERCSDDELIGLYASASAVILPSLEEGFGLPVLEALHGGVPVCCSDRVPVLELLGDDPRVVRFDPVSTHAIAYAIDEATAMPDGVQGSTDITVSATKYAGSVLAVVRGVLEAAPRRA